MDDARTGSDALLDIALEAAHAGAEVVRDAAPRRDLRWHEKGVRDFVTEVDVAAERAISAVIARRAPDAALLAEEASGHTRPDAPATGVVFVIDPLDGTTNFLHGYPEYAVSVGVVADGALVAGVVIDVPLNEVFTARAGGGAHLDGGRISVSDVAEPGRALIGTGFPFRNADRLDAYPTQLMRVMERAAGVRRAGSAALDLASVACGRFDAFWELMLSAWDVAAGILLVREAGGVCADLVAAPSRVAAAGIVAGNPVMQRWLLSVLNDNSE